VSTVTLLALRYALAVRRFGAYGIALDGGIDAYGERIGPPAIREWREGR
jgi:hypothetical protein